MARRSSGRAEERPPVRPRSLVEPIGPPSEPFRTLRVALDLVPNTRGGNVVLFTSADPGEGKSTMVANYALVSSSIDRRVLVVDVDLRNPTQHEIFGLPRAPGLTEAVFSDLDPHSLVRPITSVPGLHVLTAGAPAPRAGWDVTSSNAVRDLIVRVSSDYDIVAIDTPPILVAADAAHVAAHPLIDVVVVVDRNQRARRLNRAVSKLELIGANVVGFVLNREGSLSAYGYG